MSKLFTLLVCLLLASPALQAQNCYEIQKVNGIFRVYLIDERGHYTEMGTFKAIKAAEKYRDTLEAEEQKLS